jgi:biopolymer transport protein ExbB
VRRLSAVVFFVLIAPFATTATAYAAESDPTASARRSFLDIIVHGAEWTGIIIVLMSIAAVSIIIEHFWTIRRKTMVPVQQIEHLRQMIEARRFKECMDELKDARSMFGDVMLVGLRHGRHGFEAMRESADERASAWSSRLFRKVEYLNIIGNLGPLLGLLGTVLGMIKAFSEMQALHGAYKPENLAGGISLALVNTFLGLTVAIVSLFFFGICRNRVDALTVAAHAAVMDLLEYFRPATVGVSAMEPAPPVRGQTPARSQIPPRRDSDGPSPATELDGMPPETVKSR